MKYIVYDTKARCSLLPSPFSLVAGSRQAPRLLSFNTANVNNNSNNNVLEKCQTSILLLITSQESLLGRFDRFQDAREATSRNNDEAENEGGWTTNYSDPFTYLQYEQFGGSITGSQEHVSPSSYTKRRCLFACEFSRQFASHHL